MVVLSLSFVFNFYWDFEKKNIANLQTLYTEIVTRDYS